MKYLLIHISQAKKLYFSPCEIAENMKLMSSGGANVNISFALASSSLFSIKEGKYGSGFPLSSSQDDPGPLEPCITADIIISDPSTIVN